MGKNQPHSGGDAGGNSYLCSGLCALVSIGERRVGLVMTMKSKLLFRLLPLAVALIVLGSCNNEYNMLLKSNDYDYKYEAAKQAYMNGQYTRAYQLLNELLLVLKGTSQAEESLILMALCHFELADYETATMYFDRYVKSYPKGTYTELARYMSGRACYLQSPDPRLDQSPTLTAITNLQQFLEFYPYSERREDVTDMIFQLQNRLVKKEYENAVLYYNLGNYVGNCTNGGSNFEACIITAENALRSYPYSSLREDLYMLILRSRYELAKNSVLDKQDDRYRETIDEFYGFRNEFPDSKYMPEANRIFRHSNARLKGETIDEKES